MNSIDNYQNALGGMNSTFSQLYSNWKYHSATEAKKWAERALGPLQEDKDEFEQDQTDQRQGDAEQDRGIDLAALSFEVGKGGEGLEKFARKAVKSGVDKAGDYVKSLADEFKDEATKTGQALVNKAKGAGQELLDEGTARLRAAGQAAADKAEGTAQDIFDAAGERVTAALRPTEGISDPADAGAAGDIELPSVGGDVLDLAERGGVFSGTSAPQVPALSSGEEGYTIFGRPSETIFGDTYHWSRLPGTKNNQDGRRYLDDDPYAGRVGTHAVAEPDELAARNAARQAEAAANYRGGTTSAHSGRWIPEDEPVEAPSLPSPPTISFKPGQEGLEVEMDEMKPSSGITEAGGPITWGENPGDFPARGPSLRPKIQDMKTFKPEGSADATIADLEGDQASAVATQAADAAAAATATTDTAAGAAGAAATTATTATTAATEAAEGATEGALDVAAAADAWNPLGLILGGAAAAYGIYTAVEGASASEKAKNAANAAAMAAKKAAAAVPPPPKPLDLAGMYVNPVQSGLRGF